MNSSGPERPEHATPPAAAGEPHPMNLVHSPPPTGRPPLVAALLAVVLVVAIGAAAGIILLAGRGGAPTPTPFAGPASPAILPTPTPTVPAATPGTPSATPTVPAGTPPSTTPPGSPSSVGRTPPPEIGAQINAVVEQVPPLRELEPLRDVPYVLLTREEFQLELEGILAEEIDPEQLAAEERVLKRLGLLPSDADLNELLVELYGSQIAAYYRPDTGTFYVIERDEPFGPTDRMIVAHEYTHALQDQHFGLETNRVTDPAEGDAAIAQLAAIEGDATWLMYLWAFEHLTFAEQLELLTGVSPTEQETLDRMPLVLRRQLLFPYFEGMAFTSEVFGRGGWQAVSETITRPPASSEQVLHPAKYFANEPPIAVVLPDLPPTLGDGWSRTYQQTMGELGVQIWLADGQEAPTPGLPGPTAAWQDAAAGWGGDRLAMYENDAGDWATYWQLEWDSEEDSVQFETLARTLLPTVEGGAELHRLGPRSLILLAASDGELLLRLAP